MFSFCFWNSIEMPNRFKKCCHRLAFVTNEKKCLFCRIQYAILYIGKFTFKLPNMEYLHNYISVLFSWLYFFLEQWKRSSKIADRYTTESVYRIFHTLWRIDRIFLVGTSGAVWALSKELLIYFFCFKIEPTNLRQ